MSLTSHLASISSDTHKRATQHPFLKAAGNQTITTERLERWLSQDRIYAFVGYPKFISLLLTHLPLDTTPSISSPPTTPNLPQRTLAVLSSSLSNIVQELEFFHKTAQENNLNIMKRPKDGLTIEGDEVMGSVTRGYVDFMIATGATGSFLEGLVLLWATEKCYLDAWTYARSQIPSNTTMNKALGAFIENWTTNEFKTFVREIAGLVDEWAEKATAEEKGKAEDIYKWVLWYEVRFWDGE